MPVYFGRYQLIELIGRGGMGEVYRARDTERQREVALKLLPETLASDRQFAARFKRESLLAAQLSEPHIVPIHDFGEIDGRLYIDMRLVKGIDLATHLEQAGRLTPRTGVEIVRQVAAALDAAHAEGLVHRDVKPSNIMLTGLTDRSAPFAYLVDFGIARAAQGMTALTTSSATIGTFAYMSPERIANAAFDHRADIYALACVLFEALTGSPPFSGDVVALMYAHMTQDPPRAGARVSGLPPALDAVIVRGLSKDPEGRYASASELAFAATDAIDAPTVDPEKTTRRHAFSPAPDALAVRPAANPPEAERPPTPASSGTEPPTRPRPRWTDPATPASADQSIALPLSPSPATRSDPHIRPWSSASRPPSSGTSMPPPTNSSAPAERSDPPTRSPSTPSAPSPPPKPPARPREPESELQPLPRAARSRRRVVTAIAAGFVAAAAAASIPLLVGGGDSTPRAGSSGTAGGGPANGAGGGNTSSTPASTKTGGTIYYTNGERNVEHWDPQRAYIARDLSNMERLFTRTLVQFGTGAGVESNKIHPDLASNLGTSSNGNKVWKFTLKSGMKWQDGSTVTCADVKYGVSRTFASDVITGGPNYAIQFLDIPATPNDKKFPSAYHGPFTKVGQALYDKAVTCSGNTITFKLKKSVPDFNNTVTLPAFAPFKQSQDKGARSNYAVFSDGPYKLQGTWTAGKGGTFVRNKQYDPKTDNPTIRRALPDKFTFIEGLQTETVFDRLLRDAGQDQTLVTDRTAPPAYLARVAAQKARYTAPVSPFVDYVVPNFTRLKNKVVRQALAMSTNRAGWILAEGGSAVAEPAQAVINPSLGAAGGYKKFKAFSSPDAGDPAAAKALLQKAGVNLPYPLHFTYSGGTPTSDKQASSLAATWNKAGFKVTLEGLTNTYYDVVQNPANAAKYDVTFGGWGADWPNASTVVPALFDSRVNLSSSSNAQDYGLYKNSYVNSQIDKAYNTPDATARNKIWGNLDEFLAKDVAYVPLDVLKFPRLHGSKVANYIESTSTSGYPDLGPIGVS